MFKVLLCIPFHRLLATQVLIHSATNHPPSVTDAGPWMAAKGTKLSWLLFPGARKAGRQDKRRTLNPSKSRAWCQLRAVELKFDQQLHSLLLPHHPVSAQELGRWSTPSTCLTGRNNFMWLAHSWSQGTNITLPHRLAGCKAQ